MKKNIQALSRGRRGFLLLEGRTENAAIAIVKKINDPFLRDLLYDFAYYFFTSAHCSIVVFAA